MADFSAGIFGHPEGTMATGISYEYVSDNNPTYNSRLEIGLDTIRVGFRPPAMSWELRNRLKTKGWQYYGDKSLWTRTISSSGLRLRHGDWWIGCEVSLPRVLQADNSNLLYDHWQALNTIRQLLDDDIALKTEKSEWRSPGWDSWFVTRVDVTADFIFPDPSRVESMIAALRKAKMLYRPVRETSQPHGIRWRTKRTRISCSVYDKYKKDQRSQDIGKLRLTVKLDKQGDKTQLVKHGMETVQGLMADEGLRWVSLIRGEVARFRPFKPHCDSVGRLRLLVNEAAKANGLTPAKK